jgi:hypothetical protein
MPAAPVGKIRIAVLFGDERRNRKSVCRERSSDDA